MQTELVAAEWGGKQYLARVDGKYGVAVVVRPMTDQCECRELPDDHELMRLADDGGPAL